MKMLLVNLRFLLHDKEFRDEVMGKKWICLERKLQRGLAGPRGHKESNTTEPLNTHAHIFHTKCGPSQEREREL